MLVEPYGDQLYWNTILNFSYDHFRGHHIPTEAKTLKKCLRRVRVNIGVGCYWLRYYKNDMSLDKNWLVCKQRWKETEPRNWMSWRNGKPAVFWNTSCRTWDWRSLDPLSFIRILVLPSHSTMMALGQPRNKSLKFMSRNKLWGLLHGYWCLNMTGNK